MIIRINTKDLPRVQQQVQALVTNVAIRTKTSTKRIAQLILDDSLNVPPRAPQDTGALRETARVEATPNGHAVMYGGQASNGVYVDYAEYVHDDMRPRKYTLSGSGPKFVETHVLRREADSIGIANSDLQSLIKEIFGR